MSSAIPRSERVRLRVCLLGLCAGLAVVSGRLALLAMQHEPVAQVNVVRSIGAGWARPEITDRNGQILATDITLPSAFADPGALDDVDDAVDKLRSALPHLKREVLYRKLSDKRRRFVWIERGLHPDAAQRVHDLGLPGVGFRDELRRAYPNGDLGRSVIGQVDLDNRGVGGIERYLDATGLTQKVDDPAFSVSRPVRLSLDLGVQHALERTLRDGVERYGAKAAAGVIMDVTRGSIAGYASVSGSRATAPVGDLLNGGVYELGSVMKPIVLGGAIDRGFVTAGTRLQVPAILRVGSRRIRDLHASGERVMSVRDILLKSSNVGMAIVAEKMGAEAVQRVFDDFGLNAAPESEIGTGAGPLRASLGNRHGLLSASFGHGMAVAPLAFARAAASLVNGGRLVQPTFLAAGEVNAQAPGRRVISAQSSAVMARMLRDNVQSGAGTGTRAGVIGVDVGGKTGTAEMPGKSGYDRDRVIASFVGTFPSEAPRYLTFIAVFEPDRGRSSGGAITAGHNAAPLTAELIKRVAPVLTGFGPSSSLASPRGVN